MRLLTFALCPVAASASQWLYEDLGTPIAYYVNGAAQFQFACRGGDLAMGFWVRSPSPTVASAQSLHLAIMPDPPKGADIELPSNVSFAQDMPLIHADGTSMIIRGPVAPLWARIAQEAKSTIRLAYILKQAELEVFNTNDFGAQGSSAAVVNFLCVGNELKASNG